MPDLQDLRDLVGDSREPHSLTDDELIRCAVRNNLALFATAAELRDQLESRAAADIGAAWRRETERLRNRWRQEASGGGVIALEDEAYVETAFVTTVDITQGRQPPAGDPLFALGVSAESNPVAGIFGTPDASGPYVVPEFEGDAFIFIATTAAAIDTVQTTAFPLNQRQVWQAEPIDRIALGEVIFSVFRSQQLLGNAWSGVEIEIS